MKRIKSITLDNWKDFQLLIMKTGGNRRAMEFFQSNGIQIHNGEQVSVTEIESRYSSIVAEKYKQLLMHEVNSILSSEAVHSNCSPTVGNTRSSAICSVPIASSSKLQNSSKSNRLSLEKEEETFFEGFQMGANVDRRFRNYCPCCVLL